MVEIELDDLSPAVPHIGVEFARRLETDLFVETYRVLVGSGHGEANPAATGV